MINRQGAGTACSRFFGFMTGFQRQNGDFYSKHHIFFTNTQIKSIVKTGTVCYNISPKGVLKGMFTPNEIAVNVIGIGKKKASTPSFKLICLGIMAGMFIALAAVGANTGSSVVENASIAKLIAACIFPAGLVMVLLAGSELFTGNCLIIVSVIEKESTMLNMLRNWLCVYFGNFIGAIIVAFCVNAAGQLDLFGGALALTTMKTAAAKAALPFGKAVILGVFCNFLVCIAVWISFAAKTVSGKIIGLFMPVMLFVLSGFEHSVANMYYIPAGIFASMNPAYAEQAASIANIDALTWGGFISNLIPVTIGNIIGGMVMVGMMYWLIYLKKDSTPAPAPAAKQEKELVNK